MSKTRTVKKAEPPILNRIAIVLKEERKTNRWLAAETGFSETTISQWANNRKQPNLYSLYLISLLLQRDLRDLVISSTAVEQQLREEQIKLLKLLGESGKRTKSKKSNG